MVRIIQSSGEVYEASLMENAAEIITKLAPDSPSDYGKKYKDNLLDK